MINLNFIYGLISGVVIVLLVLLFFRLFKRLNEIESEIKAFYEREKEYSKMLLDTMKSVDVVHRDLKRDIEITKNSILSPENLAKEILKIKFSTKDIPEDVMEEYNTMVSKDKKDKSYIG